MDEPTPGPQRSISPETQVRSTMRNALMALGLVATGSAGFGSWMTVMQTGQTKLADGQAEQVKITEELRAEMRAEFAEVRREMRDGLDEIRVRMSSNNIIRLPVTSNQPTREGNP